jgi:PEGA domain
MRFPRWMNGCAVFVAVGMVAPVRAGDGAHRHSQRGTDVVVAEGALPVRPVGVREVQVREVVAPPVARPQPSVAPRTDVVPRPFLPDSISRPQGSQYRRPSMSNHGRRAYYRFSPRFNVGYGLLVGYPIIYPYPYANPFLYDPAPAPYGASSSSLSMAAPPRNTYSNVESVTAGAPATTSLACGVDPAASVPCGGVSFEVAPGNAQVSVEGVFVGTVEAFSSTEPPLVLAPGVHYIEVRMPGYRTAAFEVIVAAGEVTPYQGALEPLQTR